MNELKKHLEEIFGTFVGMSSAAYHVFKSQEIKILEGIIYTFFVSIFGLTLAHFYKKFLVWIDKKI